MHLAVFAIHLAGALDCGGILNQVGVYSWARLRVARCITARVFESWPVGMDPPTRQVIEPPRAVLVDLGGLIANPADKFRSDEVSMRIKMEGLDFRGQVSGCLHAWAQSTRGGWLGLVTCTVPTGNGAGSLTMTQWCPANAITPIGTPAGRSGPPPPQGR